MQWGVTLVHTSPGQSDVAVRSLLNVNWLSFLSTVTVATGCLSTLSSAEEEQQHASEPDGEGSGQYIVLCPDRVRLMARNSLVNEVEFLALIPQSGKDQ